MAACTRIRAAVRRRAQRAAMRAVGKAGYDLTPKHFYKPFPDVERLPASLWRGPRPLEGVDLRIDHAAELLRDLAPYVEEFTSGGFPVFNGSYESVDAEVLYGLLRHLKPRRVIEFGAGVSSHIIALANGANGRDGQRFEFVSYDPFPGEHPMGLVPGGDVRPVATEDLDPTVVDGLRDGDVLFVDTTHTVKTGGDVVHIVLDLLPRLADGVYVHFHDIFLPYEYPRVWVVDERRAWAEQYLLQAFLSFNPSFEVVLPAHALSRERADLVRSVVPSSAHGGTPGAFWIRRT